MRLAAAVAVLALLAAACASAEPNRRAAVHAGGDWTRFGYDAARRNAGPASTGITAENKSPSPNRSAKHPRACKPTWAATPVPPGSTFKRAVLVTFI